MFSGSGNTILLQRIGLTCGLVGNQRRWSVTRSRNDITYIPAGIHKNNKLLKVKVMFSGSGNRAELKDEGSTSFSFEQPYWLAGG